LDAPTGVELESPQQLAAAKKRRSHATMAKWGKPK
jgi:hypothetical protein